MKKIKMYWLEVKCFNIKLILMIRVIFLISILSITMTYCEGQPKTTEDSKSSVVFISDTVNNKIDVKINRALFTSYIYDKT